MIKNINDLLSFIVLIVLVIYSQGFLVYFYLKGKRKELTVDTFSSRWQLFKDYNDNIEE